MPIYHGIDLDTDVRPFLPRLRGWCDFVGRYSKNLAEGELQAIAAAGLKTLLIYEAGANNSLGGESQGRADAAHFLRQCQALFIHPGDTSGVFPTCDTDPTPSQILTVQAYWYGFSAVVFPAGWRYMGAYGPGTLLTAMLPQGLAYPWSAGAKGWSGTRAFDLTHQWVINQGPPTSGGTMWPAQGQIAGVDPFSWPDIGLGPQGYDPNVAINLDWAL